MRLMSASRSRAAEGVGFEPTRRVTTPNGFETAPGTRFIPAAAGRHGGVARADAAPFARKARANPIRRKAGAIPNRREHAGVVTSPGITVPLLSRQTEQVRATEARDELRGNPDTRALARRASSAQPRVLDGCAAPWGRLRSGTPMTSSLRRQLTDQLPPNLVWSSHRVRLYVGPGAVAGSAEGLGESVTWSG